MFFWDSVDRPICSHVAVLHCRNLPNLLWWIILLSESDRATRRFSSEVTLTVLTVGLQTKGANCWLTRRQSRWHGGREDDVDKVAAAAAAATTMTAAAVFDIVRPAGAAEIKTMTTIHDTTPPSGPAAVNRTDWQTEGIGDQTRRQPVRVDPLPPDTLHRRRSMTKHRGLDCPSPGTADWMTAPSAHHDTDIHTDIPAALLMVVVAAAAAGPATSERRRRHKSARPSLSRVSCRVETSSAWMHGALMRCR